MSSAEIIRQILECFAANRAVEHQPSARNSQNLVSAINLAAKMLDMYIDRRIEMTIRREAQYHERK